ncbi:S8 family serine peptidase [Spirillospora sp. NPDC029432]|uniref:S8 family serine peptidase n=1 Tax=Spirillospora sp. NPDC029432 TaxID=3154599 RepID=UPI003455AE98
MRGLGALICGAFLLLPQAPAAAAPAPRCETAPGVPGPVAASWADRRLNLPRARTPTAGRGTTVAVIDSGADTSHPMLAGRVAKTLDLTGTGPRDCAGHGTGVAALIAGRDLGGGTAGVAPAARLLVVKQQDTGLDESDGARLPRAVRAAADAGAQVVNVSIKAGPSPALAEAVRYAQSRDVLIVAAAGNAEKEGGDAVPAYPASYPGVLSVASLGPDGARAESSSVQSRVDLAAPGKGIPTAWPGGGYNPQAEGTSYAAAYVSGAAALVRSRHPHLNRQQVANRLVTTADGNAGTGTGRGMINPVQAVTAVIPGETAPLPQASPRPAALTAPEPSDARTRDLSTAVTGGALAAAALAALAGVVLPVGRRRRWRPGRAVPPAPALQDEPEIVTGAVQGTIGGHTSGTHTTGTRV